MPDYMVEFTVETMFAGRIKVSAPNEEEANRRVMEEEDMDYDSYLEIEVPTIKILKVEKFDEEKCYDY
jgi:hypothetical protein